MATGASAGSPKWRSPFSQSSRSDLSAAVSDRSFAHLLAAPRGDGAANHGGIVPFFTTSLIIAAWAMTSLGCIKENGAAPPGDDTRHNSPE